MDDGKNYLKTLVFVFIAFGSFILALVGAYFLGVGLYFGQSVVEGDVFTGGYKYDCNNPNETAAECTNLSSTETTAFTNYETFRTSVNEKTVQFLTGTTIVFSLLALVFLFLALNSSGIMNRKKEKKEEF